MKQDRIPSTLRIELFSDAVMAIICTLLVLELKVPELGKFSAMPMQLQALLIWFQTF